MRTQKSADARSRSTQLIPDIHDRILKALAGYQWRTYSPMLHFAMVVGIGETTARRKLRELAELGKVRPIVTNKIIIYQLVDN
jgi:ribosomal protein S25